MVKSAYGKPVFTDCQKETPCRGLESDAGKRGKIIVAWGNSHSANLIVNESKKELLEFLQSTQRGNVCQLIAENMITETEGTHILFWGLRYADDEWHLADYPVKSQLEKISALIQKRQPKKAAIKDTVVEKKPAAEKKQTKKGKRSEKDVFTDNEPA